MANDYKYNGKEFINDLGLNLLDYGARLYDPLTARWNGVDALAEKYHSTTGYGYVGGNPVSRGDIDGREYYYATDGRFLGKEGNNNDVYIVPDGAAYLPVILIHNLRNVFGTTYIGDYDDLVHTAATAYGESSHGFGVDNHDEVFGIANAIHNHQAQRLTNGDYQGSIRAMVETNYAYAAQNQISTYTQLRDATPQARNGTFMQTAMAAGINAMGLQTDLPGASDYANGGTHWDGIDFKIRKYAAGFSFTFDRHKVLGLENNPVSGAPRKEYHKGGHGQPVFRGSWTYAWNSTAMYGLNRTRDNQYFFTIIMKADENFKKARGNKGY